MAGDLMRTNARRLFDSSLLPHGVAWVSVLIMLVQVVMAAEPMIITSASKQFIVRGVPQRSMLAGGGGDDVVFLDPQMLAVGCERVKQTLAKELGWGERWHGTIYVNIQPLQSDNAWPTIRPFRTQDGWRYRLDVPDEIERRRLLEAIVDALLLEFANRAAIHEPADLPPWLAEGITAHLMQGPLAGIALQARTLREISSQPELRVARTSRHGDIDRLLRQRVQQNGALSVDQLNWPEFDDNDTASAEAYRHSAHLFVRELLRLRGGPDCICAMLAMLPEHLNWQTAFLRGFEPHFRRMLDAEKWWALTLTQLKTHESSIVWSVAEAELKLEQILSTPMQVRSGRDQMPQMAALTLQTVINEWDFQQQLPLLRTKLAQLQAARIRLPAELGALGESYRAVIETYLRARAGAWFELTARNAARNAVAELDALDAKRAKSPGKVLAVGASEQLGAVPLTPP